MKEFKKVDLEFIKKHNLKFIDNAGVYIVLKDSLFVHYSITFELGLCLIYSDRFNYYVGSSDGYIKINKIRLCYTIYKSYIIKLNIVIKMLLKF